MAVGIRIRRPSTGAIVLDTTDYTMSVYYRVVLNITGSGSLVVSGLNLSDFIPVIIPYDYPPVAKMFPNYKYETDKGCAQIPRAWISGNSIMWQCVNRWTARKYTIMLVRYR